MKTYKPLVTPAALQRIIRVARASWRADALQRAYSFLEDYEVWIRYQRTSLAESYEGRELQSTKQGRCAACGAEITFGMLIRWLGPGSVICEACARPITPAKVAS